MTNRTLLRKSQLLITERQLNHQLRRRIRELERETECGAATVERASRILAGKLVRNEQRIKAAVRDSAVIEADEAGLRVAGGNGWIHVARTERLTHFAYDGRRGKAAI
jgi:hypothetical protein